jgi:hypothetical protein
MTLLLKTARDYWRSYLFWALGLLALVAIEISVFPTVRSPPVQGISQSNYLA